MTYREQVGSACKRSILLNKSVGQGKHIAENLQKLILNQPCLVKEQFTEQWKTWNDKI
jgi:hypothetical protein